MHRWSSYRLPSIGGKQKRPSSRDSSGSYADVAPVNQQQQSQPSPQTYPPSIAPQPSQSGMPPIYYGLDPDGDVIFCLMGHVQIPDPHVQVQQSPIDDRVPGSQLVPDGQSESSQQQPQLPPPSLPSQQQLQHPQQLPPQPPSHSISSEPREIRIMVSSRHLILSSRYFRSMFRNETKERAILRSKGSIEIALPSDDPEALLIILNIVHGHNRRVPREVDLSTLTEIACVVEKYGFQEAVEVYQDFWLAKLKAGVPNTWTEDLLPWMWISWVFKMPYEFQKTTQIAQLESKGRLGEEDECDLPIPNFIIDTIQRDRVEALNSIITKCDKLLRRYELPPVKCAPECDLMVLGALNRNFKRLGLTPRPSPPFRGFSVKRLASQLRHMECPTFCDSVNRRWVNFCDNVQKQQGYRPPERFDGAPGKCRGLMEELREEVGGMEKRFNGLGLKQFAGVGMNGKPM